LSLILMCYVDSFMIVPIKCELWRAIY